MIESSPAQISNDTTRSSPSKFAHVAALDGLRGLAVAIVVVYHFAPDVLPAGFIGVDVFFVLSGFLITSLALRERSATGGFSSGGFYKRRARRLLPAAIVTVVVAVALAAVIQPVSTRAATRGQGIASLLYVANWWMIDQHNSYQAAFGTESPLSHFWSLAVEEQFYVVFPLLLLGLILLVRRRGRLSPSMGHWLLGVSIVGALASATLMAVMYTDGRDPSRVYLGTDTRVHAIFVGVAVACVWWLWSSRLRGRAASGALAVAGAACAIALAAVCVFADFQSPWLFRYGFLAIAVASGVIVLALMATGPIVTKVFEFRAIVVLGVVSYSVYLWHWPVRVFVNSSNTPLHGIWLFVVRVAITAVAATISFLLIERPFRTATDGRRIALGSIGALVASVALVAVVSRPVPGPSTEFSIKDAPTADTSAQQPVRILWFGDSAAWVLGGGHLDFPHPVGYDSPFDSTKVLIWNKADYGCPLVRYPQRSFDTVKQNVGWCVERETQWPPLIEQFHPDVVSWSSVLFDTYDYRVDGKWVRFGTPEWDAIYDADLESTRALVVASGAKFMLIGQADPLADPSQTGDGQETLLPQNIWHFGHVRDLQRAFADRHAPDTVFVDLQPIVCPDDSCRGVVVSPNATRPDGVHFTAAAVRDLAPQMQAAIEAALGR